MECKGGGEFVRPGRPRSGLLTRPDFFDLCRYRPCLPLGSDGELELDDDEELVELVDDELGLDVDGLVEEETEEDADDLLDDLGAGVVPCLEEDASGRLVTECSFMMLSTIPRA